MRFLTLSFVVAATSISSASLVYDESVSGDLSSDPDSPTALNFSLGENIVTGTVVSSADVRDFFTFTIDDGYQLDSLRLLNYEDLPSGNPGDRGFHAINLGVTSFIPAASTAANFLGGDHLDPVPSGTDLLPTLAGAPLAGTGFEIPLGAGDYTYLIQQTGPEVTGYSVAFDVAPATAVPEPSSRTLWMLLCVCVAGFSRARRLRAELSE